MSYCSDPSCYLSPCNVHEGKVEVPAFTLANRVQMPALGFGCAFGNWTDKTKLFAFLPEQAWAAIPGAFRAGFRHFDGALAYLTHKILGHSIGMELARGSVKREELFITSKVFNPTTSISLNRLGKSFDFSMDVSQVKERILLDFEKCLDELSLGYLDLLLLHWPGDFNSTDEARGRAFRKEAWAAFEEIYKSGRVRAIGVSNFLIRHLEGLKVDGATIVPMVNQIEVSPYIAQKELVGYCQANNIHVSAWSPFGAGDQGLLSDPCLVQLADKYKKNVGQIILRWIYQYGLSSLPRSSNEARLRSNLQIFDFELEKADVDAIFALDRKACAADNIA